MELSAKTRLWAVRTYKNVGWAGAMLMLASAPTASPRLAGGSCVALLAWGVACCLPGLSDTVRIWAKGTRSARADLFKAMRSGQPKGFRALPRIEQAAAARRDPAIQRRLWWEASAVMWMLANPGKEHQWRGMLSEPGWFDDSLAWRNEVISKLEAAADEGWICPNANVAWLLGRPEMGESKKELGQEMAAFAQMGDPWPSRARFCDTISSMGHSLYGKGFSEALAWRSHGALERLRLTEELPPAGSELRSAGRLRL